MDTTYEVIIIGGSYAGLSAALTLGRSLRKTLVIDAKKPCNEPTPHSHNFLTQDGVTPSEIAATAKAQVEKYDTVHFLDGVAIQGIQTAGGFKVTTQAGEHFSAKKLIFATGLKDLMPDIDGFAECWGKSVLHCPYCHGYEVHHQPTGIIANGEKANHYAILISNWTKNLTLFTNGPSTLTDEQAKKIVAHGIAIVETPIEKLVHKKGQIKELKLIGGTGHKLSAIYSSAPTVQHSAIPETLGCGLSDEGLITVDEFQCTTVPGVYACGDNSNFRSVALAVSSGLIAGVVTNKVLIEEEF
ncbi:NAD(P)/FAD-dependent oxidoreductase [Reichenbachiella carrageenanivorans]|uniref:NAD(P)/FAD-dependent oxidoreductase n=1 Tax=Reichenbachiella carrageenanivorans TaxID=2979869 RepID=A0ABY6D2H6_9BACT|nr:NAD(P)/FAD-dependent oxidoreductase [Reichenbachiella carrageenanivorans]UXX80365.1 NAD(P)/FAD-dependent oxidoreductase [Reichenbachiella carrageenanivorans]